MLDGLKRLFSGPGAAMSKDWEGVVPWATTKQYTFREVQGEGFVIDGRMSTTPWRMEWQHLIDAFLQFVIMPLHREEALADDE